LGGADDLKHNTSRCEEIDTRFPGLVAAIINSHKVQSEALRRAQRKKRTSAG
jgi:hypothetical protein